MVEPPPMAFEPTLAYPRIASIQRARPHSLSAVPKEEEILALDHAKTFLKRDLSAYPEVSV